MVFFFRARIASLGALCVLILHAGVAQALLNLGVESGPLPAVPGEQLHVEVVASNTDASDELLVSLELVLPTGIAPFDRDLITGPWLSTTCSQIGTNSTCEAGETIFWQINTLSGGQSAMGTLPPLVDPGFGPGSMTFVATLLQNGSPLIIINDVIDVVATQDLDVTIEAGQSPVASGDDYTYTLHYGNRSTTTSAPNASLELTVPSGTSFVSASDGGTLGAGAVTWALGTLAPGEGGEVRATMNVAGPPNGTLLFTRATLTDTSPTPQETEAVSLTEVDSSPALQLGLEVGADPAEPGEQLTVELIATNVDPLDLDTTTMRMRLPEGIEPFQRSQLTGLWLSSSCAQLGSNSTCESGEAIFWGLTTVDAGQSRVGTLPPIVASVPDGTLIEFRANASAEADERSTANAAVVVADGRILSVSVDEDRDPVAAGSDYDYVLHYGNRSTTATAPSATLELELPWDTTFVDASDGGVLVGDTIQWSLGSLAPGDEGERRATLQVDGGPVDGALLRARAALSDASTPTREARTRTLTEVDSVGQFQLSIEATPDPADTGEQLAVEVTLSNRSAAALSSTAYRMRVPEGIEPFQRSQLTGPWVSSSCAQLGSNSTCESGEKIVWNPVTLDAGQSSTGTLPPLVATVDDGTLIRFRAEADGVGDEVAAASRSVAVSAGRELTLGIEEDRNPVAPGDPVEYTLHFGNRSLGTTVTAASLSLRLPPDTAFISASDGGASIGGTVVWSLGSVAPGASGERTVVLQPDLALVDGDQLAAHARLVASGTSPGEVRASTVTEIDADESIELAVDVGPSDPGKTFSIDVTLTNTTAAAISPTAYTLRLPDDIQEFALNTVTGPWASSSCSQLGLNSTCQGGEEILWQSGSLDAGESSVGTIPVVTSEVADGSLIDFRVVATGPGDARAEATRIVPEPGQLWMIVGGVGLLVGLDRRNLRRRRPADWHPDQDSNLGPAA